MKILEMTLHGVPGRRPRSIHDRLSFDASDFIHAPAGSLECAIFPLEDWATAAPRPSHFGHLPHGYHRLILSDSPGGDPATPFAINWDQGWHPQLFAKWGAGKLYPDLLHPEQKPFALCGHFQFERLRWYHLLLSWNHPQRRLRLYVNGVRVAAEDRFLNAFADSWSPDPAGPTLYYGGQDHYACEPSGWSEESDAATVSQRFEAFAARTDRIADTGAIRRQHAGSPRPTRVPSPDAWPEHRSYPMRSGDDLRDCYIQGYAEGVRVDAEGLEVRTPQRNPNHSIEAAASNQGHVYLWFPDFVEGDLRLDYDFKILEPGGLSLFIAQAAGIQGERFLEDYPRRDSAAMKMVCWEDVRNYHLEYYREMNDVRNDLATFALMKNPWLRPLGFATRTAPFATDRWYHLSFQQEDGQLRLFIDDDLVIDARDDPFENNGPLLQRGYVALRCMVRTAMRFRNIDIRWRPLYG